MGRFRRRFRRFRRRFRRRRTGLCEQQARTPRRRWSRSSKVYAVGSRVHCPEPPTRPLPVHTDSPTVLGVYVLTGPRRLPQPIRINHFYLNNDDKSFQPPSVGFVQLQAYLMRPGSSPPGRRFGVAAADQPVALAMLMTAHTPDVGGAGKERGVCAGTQRDGTTAPDAGLQGADSWSISYVITDDNNKLSL